MLCADETDDVDIPKKPLPIAERMVPSIAAALLAVERGARVVRVHDVRETVQALKVWTAASL
jgi:dihydropteroate synthase